MKKISFVLIIFSLASCEQNSSTKADVFIQKYCNCLEENKVQEDYYNARVICDSKFALKYPYYKIGMIEALFGSRAVEKYPSPIMDSAHAFNREIRRRIETECPFFISPDSSSIVY